VRFCIAALEPIWGIYYEPSMALVFVMLALIVSIFGAWVMHRLVERPGVALGKRFKYRPLPATGVMMPVP
jgi:peptidoglycan/LPS O-acetylase OafA/YrhL